MIGGVGEYSFDLPLNSFENKKLFRLRIYKYHDKDADVMIESNGDFVINIRHADLARVNQSEMPLITVEAGNLIGQKLTSLVCRKNKCSTRFEQDNDRDQNRDNGHDYFDNGFKYDHHYDDANDNYHDENHRGTQR